MTTFQKSSNGLFFKLNTQYIPEEIHIIYSFRFNTGDGGRGGFFLYIMIKKLAPIFDLNVEKPVLITISY